MTDDGAYTFTPRPHSPITLRHRVTSILTIPTMLLPLMVMAMILAIMYCQLRY
ncbi:hypothetical protein O9929_20715 [Vibrio lentus]|nr:hypothetical protein [Vibrio lentus]